MRAKGRQNEKEWEREEKKGRKKDDNKSPSDCDMIQWKFIHEFVTLGRNKNSSCKE